MIKFFLILVSAALLYAQEFYFQNSFGDFTDASSFSYNQSGYFFVCDHNTNEVYKLDTIGTVIKYIGGYGWKESTFDDPVFVYSTLLNIYITDENNHRIQIFDKDLNFISQLNKKNFESKDNASENILFGYPLGCVVSSMGDYFVLDSENKRIIKYDINGNFLLKFGGYDAGKFSLSNPLRISISPDNKIFVLDDTDLVIFDQFGNGLVRIKMNENFMNMNITYDQIVINDKSSIYFANLDQKGFELKKIFTDGYELNNNIVQGLKTRENLFILTKNKILFFKTKKAD